MFGDLWKFDLINSIWTQIYDKKDLDLVLTIKQLGLTVMFS